MRLYVWMGAGECSAVRDVRNRGEILTTTHDSAQGGPSANARNFASGRKRGSASDPLWYKDALIYELHVRAFFDSNNDGIGDFPGLLQKLDYLQELGITCLWLLPFFPSPLRDDGYDISDYVSVHPSYGTLEDFKAFLDAAHDRGLQVMIELVVNHTSDQHPWFQASRRAAPGSPERDFYVWSDTDQKYKDARIIFTDTEKSNWTWDPVANAYYWHRFFSHQPDLNYDNPRVLEEVINVMRFWLDMGVDGLRVDAIPYLVEREGTNCENLPETHAVMKRIRAEIDQYYSGRVILAEANQWPMDVLPYFGNGDECHMAFHFPLMPRIYMALRQEDRLPITDIMAQTPPIPDTCQWGLFLRNHDELTLEMVTDDERDYMYLAYSADPRMRINIGIRRRLAPLLDNNRRRIELLNSLLFSFPGTPILYYGDEIGMGDNIYLGDRNGVRTPMQWNGDRNAGFSRANPARLYSPVVMDPVWGYEAVNVEAQQGDPSSLLSWTRNMIALRKIFQVFGRGTLTFLNPSNRKILAYLREMDGQRILCVANLSRFAQPFQLDLQAYDGMVPVEMLGYIEFPHIGKQPYPLTLGPYGFLWFELQQTAEDTGSALKGQDGLEMPGKPDWAVVLSGENLERLQVDVLPDYLQRQRWFVSRSQPIRNVEIANRSLAKDGEPVIVLLRVSYAEDLSDLYLLPMAMCFGEAVEGIRTNFPQAVLATIHGGQGEGLLYDAFFSDVAAEKLLDLIRSSGTLPTLYGELRGVAKDDLAKVEADAPPMTVRRPTGEQNLSTLIFRDQAADRWAMKIFRRQEAGPNPDREMHRYLWHSTGFRNLLPVGGGIDYISEAGETSTVAMLQDLIENEGDGWQWTLEELDRFYERCSSLEVPARTFAAIDASLISTTEFAVPPGVNEHIEISLDAARTLGRRTGELHLALATPTSEAAFAPERFSNADLVQLREDIGRHTAHAFAVLKVSVPSLPDELVDMAALVLSRRGTILDRVRSFPPPEFGALRTRIHGDYHLGQLLRSKSDVFILNFDGPATQSIEERRRKQSPLKDVASMVRSFSYAAYAARMRYAARRPEHQDRLKYWSRLWDKAVVSEFLRSYRTTVQNAELVPATAETFELLLRGYVFDKTLDELLYELKNRPAWVEIPLAGILSLRANNNGEPQP
ncbi:MAG TPA: maltose alpha-D-glucosyltransferase [Acidisarcina sp.]|nr:maltose alpha-D-glucosyltransferase [Acidisarcina sp.]